MTDPATRARIDEARAHHRRGEFHRAISMYQRILEEEPTLAEVWHLKGMAEHQSGDLDNAAQSAAEALARAGEHPHYLFLEGSVLHDRGDLGRAAQRFARVAELRPDWAPGHVELGLVRLDQGQAQAALACFQAAVSADPGNASAWNNLATALHALERIEEALRAFDHTVSLDPRFALAHFNLARIHALQGRADRAMEHAQMAARLDPRHLESWILVGELERRSKNAEAALAAYQAASRIAPADPRPPSAIAQLLAEAGRFDLALAEYQRAAARAPQSAKPALGACLLLPQVYAGHEELDAHRRRYAEGLERLHESAGRFRFASPAAALADLTWTNFYLAYQGRDDAILQRRYGELHRRVLGPVMPQLFEARARPMRERPRVGFFSHFFFNCTAGRYFASWITRLDRSRFESFVYYTNPLIADDTRAIAAAAATFRHLPGVSLMDVAQRVKADDLDVLIYPELGMHAETFALAGLRLAPVQACGWGHPTTPGLPEMDWYISCEPMEDAGSSKHYNERLALLPGLGTHYAVAQRDATGTRADFGLPDDRTIYLVPQSLFKIHPDNDELIAEVLARDERGVALFFSASHEETTNAFATRLAASFERRGLDIHTRAIFMRSNVPHPTYLRLNELCDVMLDTVHWSGGNTTLDALASGLPVVTLPGALMRGRQSKAMLEILGLARLVASNPDAFVETAVGLGRDRDSRAEVSEQMASRRGELFERDEAIRALERFIDQAAHGG